jgi:hypothetical protein
VSLLFYAKVEIVWQYRDASSEPDEESSGAFSDDDVTTGDLESQGQGRRDLGRQNFPDGNDPFHPNSLEYPDDDDDLEPQGYRGFDLDLPFVDYSRSEDVESGEITYLSASCPKLGHLVSRLRYCYFFFL